MKWAAPAFAVALVFAALAVSGIVPGLRFGKHRPAISARGASSAGADGLAVYSSARQAAPEASPSTVAAADQAKAARAAADARSSDLAAKQQADEAAAQAAAALAAQQSALAQQQRDLEQRAAAQQAAAAALAQEQARVAAEKQQAEAAAAEAERLKQQEAQRAAVPVYSGPSSGEIVWQGEVQGTTLVTINGSSSDVGRVVSGALPGVLVMLQPADGKHVGIAATPSPSNRFQRLTLRVQGKGMLQEVIHWSVP
jgi:hypothetical protein